MEIEENFDFLPFPGMSGWMIWEGMAKTGILKML
jgi:hypothetical protein